MYLYTLAPYSLSHHTVRPAFCRVNLVDGPRVGVERSAFVFSKVA